MTKKTIHTAGAPAAIGPYSQAVSAGGWLYCSGQIALDPKSGALVTGGAREQAARCLENLAAVLSAAGAGFSDVVKTTVYLADLADFAAVNEVYAEYFPEDPPARACVQAAALPKGARVEIDCVAKLP